MVFKIPLLFYRLGLSWLVPAWILILGTTSHLDDISPWLSLELRTPFSPYPKNMKRY